MRLLKRLTEAESGSWASWAGLASYTPPEALTEAELQRRKVRREAVRTAHQLKLRALRSDVRHQRAEALRSAVDAFRPPSTGRKGFFGKYGVFSSKPYHVLKHFQLTKGATVLLDVARNAYLTANSEMELEAVIRDIDLLLPVVDMVFHGAVALRDESEARPDTELAKTFLRTLRAFASSRLRLPVPNLMQLLGLQPAEARVDTRAPSHSLDFRQLQREFAELKQVVEREGRLTRKNQALLRGPDQEANLTEMLTVLRDCEVREAVGNSTVEFVQEAERMLLEVIGPEADDGLTEDERRMFGTGLILYSRSTGKRADCRQVGASWGIAGEDLLKRTLFGRPRGADQSTLVTVQTDSTGNPTHSRSLENREWSLTEMARALENLRSNPALRDRLHELGFRQGSDALRLHERIRELSSTRNVAVHGRFDQRSRRLTMQSLGNCWDTLFRRTGLIRLLTGCLRPQS